MNFVIPSKNRSESIAGKTLRLIPDAFVCVAENEYNDYKKICDAKKIIVHPNEIVGIGPLRNWIVQNLSDDAVVMLDDDITHIYDQTNYKKIRIEEPNHCMSILERTAIAAADAGCKIFGYTQMATPLSYRPFLPIALNTWVGGVVGVIGKDTRWDDDLILRADIDACLRSLLKDRITWVDTRYCWIHMRFVGSGGNNLMRSMARHEYEIKKLKTRWGRYLGLKKEKGTIRLTIQLKR